MGKKKPEKPRKPKAVKKIPKPKPPPEKPKPAPKFQDPLFQELLYHVAGEQGIVVGKVLLGKELTDEDLAKRTGISINLVRRILYELYDSRVVSYRRTRDEESGWYIYHWKIDPERAIEHVRDNRRLLLRKLEERLERERNTAYFTCEGEDPKVPYEVAIDTDFKCPRCGGRLKPYDNTSVIVSLERRVQLLREQLMKG
jgi:transcription initiation factor TFIIE subunit alpha